MAKKKSSMALFEVVAREKRHDKAALSVPAWMKGQGVADESAGPQDPPQEQEQAYVAQVQPEAPAEPNVEPDAARDAGDDDVHPTAEQTAPILAVADGRVTVSLNYVSCAVAGAAVLLVLVLAFVLGRASAPGPKGRADTPAARANLVVGARPPRTTPRVPGKYYLVIQELGGLTAALKEDGRAVADYCEAARGDPATVVSDGRQYVVLSGKAFDRPDSPEARVYAADIDALGKRYQTDTNSRYDFNQMDTRGRLDPWFRKEQ